MDLATASMLCGAGIVGGAMAGLVGGASLITFPAMLAAGLHPVVATASNLMAVIPANFVAGLVDRSQIPKLDRAFAVLVLTTVVGAAAGAALLLLTPGRLFEVLVPLLLGFATVLFAYSARISQWLANRAAATGRLRSHGSATNVAMLLPVSIYGGYFGAGLGVMVLAVLAIVTGGDYRAANAVKNLMVSLNTTVAALLLAAYSVVAWPETAAMAVGSVLGGLLGGTLARIAPPAVIRVVVIFVGALLTLVFAWRYWF
jgi:uncharacterized membrane protein YfcA